MSNYNYEDKTKKELVKELLKRNKQIINLKKKHSKLIVQQKKIRRLNIVYSVLYKINEAIVRIKEPKKLFTKACQIIVKEGSFRMAWVGLVEPKNQLVKPIAYSGNESGYLGKTFISVKNIPEGRGPTGTAIREKKSAIFNDLEHDTRMEPWRVEAIRRGYKSSAAFPLFIGKKAIGALTIHSSEPDFFDSEKVKFFKTLVNDLSFARESIDNEKRRKKAQEEIKKSREQLRNLAVHLQTIREQERSKIAHTLHDELGQILTILKMDLSLMRDNVLKKQNLTLGKIESMINLVEQLIEDIRRISIELRPVILDHFGLAAAIEWQVSEFQKKAGIKCDIFLTNEHLHLSSEQSISIFRICQEALNNVYRHAKATKVSIILKKEGKKLILEVKDNGIGIRENAISNSKSFGLIGIRELINYWGGELKIKGIKDKGTTIVTIIPIQERE